MERYLKIPLLAGLFADFKHPSRLPELKLGPHLERAAQTSARVDRATFFTRFGYPTIGDEEGQPDATAALTYFRATCRSDGGGV